MATKARAEICAPILSNISSFLFSTDNTIMRTYIEAQIKEVQRQKFIEIPWNGPIIIYNGSLPFSQFGNDNQVKEEAFVDGGKQIQLENQIFPSRDAEALTRALMGLRAAYFIIWWVLCTYKVRI